MSTELDYPAWPPGLSDALAGMSILKECRGWERPSDHVPVTATMEI